MSYTYKCVPVPTELDTGKAGKDAHASAVTAYESIINSVAAQGWELVQADAISSVQQPGCLAAIFGRKAEYSDFKLLIFRKEVG